jgi:hypothetical protein
MDRKKFLTTLGTLGLGIIAAPIILPNNLTISGKRGDSTLRFTPEGETEIQFWGALLSALGGWAVTKLADWIVGSSDEQKEVQRTVRYPVRQNNPEIYNWTTPPQTNYNNYYYNGLANRDFYVPFHNAANIGQYTRLGWPSVLGLRRAAEDYALEYGASPAQAGWTLQPYKNLLADPNNYYTHLENFYHPYQAYQDNNKVEITYSTNGMGSGTLRFKVGNKFDFTYNIGYD